MIIMIVIFTMYCLVGLKIACATSEPEVLGSVPESGKVLVGILFSIRIFSVAVKESRFVSG